MPVAADTRSTCGTGRTVLFTCLVVHEAVAVVVEVVADLRRGFDPTLADQLSRAARNPAISADTRTVCLASATEHRHRFIDGAIAVIVFAVTALWTGFARWCGVVRWSDIR